MKKLICLVLTFCMLLSFAPAVFAAPGFEVQKAAFAQSITNQSAFSVEAEGNYAYLSSREGGVQIFDISDFSNITNTSRLLPDTATVPTDGESVKIYNGYLYVGFNDRIRKYSLTDPSAPELKAEAADAQVISFAFWGDYMFTVNNHSGWLIMWNISGDGITEVMRDTKVPSMGKHRAVFVEGNKLFVGCPSGMRIFDISTSGISEVNSITIGSGDLRHIASNGGYVFFTNTGGDMYIIDLDKNLNTLTAGDVVTKNYPSTEFRGLYVDGNVMYYSTNGGKLVLLDVSDINNPVEIACESGLGQLPGIDVQNGIVYAANRNSGMAAIKVPQIAYLSLSAQAVTSLPVTIKGGVISADGYDLYLGGEKIKSADGKTINETIKSVANGEYKLGVAAKGSAEISEYNFSVSVSGGAEISVTNQNGEALAGVADLSGAKVVVENKTNGDFGGTVVAALYKANKMVEYKTTQISALAAGAKENFDLGLTGGGEDCALKVFALASAEEPALLSNVFYLSGTSFSKEDTSVSSSFENSLDLSVAQVNHSAKNAVLDIFSKSFYGDYAVVEVIKPDGSGFLDLDYIDAVKLENEKGSVLYSFNDLTEQKPFKVKTAVCGIFGGYLTAEDEFTYVGPVTIEGILDTLESSSNTEQVLKDNSSLFRIDMSAGGKYDTLETGYQTEILKTMKQDFADTDAVKTAFEEAVSVAEDLKQINSSPNAEAVKSIFEQSETRAKLGINEKVYAAMDSETKTDIAQEIFKTSNENNSPFYSKQALAAKYNSDGVLILLNNAGYLDMGEVLKTWNEAVESEYKLELSGNYSLLEDTDTQLVYVHKIMERTDFDTLTAVKTAFNEAVLTAYANKLAQNASQGSKPAGGGGGGGGGSTVKITPAAVAGDTAENTPNGEAETGEKFVDLSEAEWSKEAVLSLSDKGIVNGYPDGSFMPNAFVTREEFSKMIFCALELEKAKDEHLFEDVKTDDWFYDYVAALCETKIINGESESFFGTGGYLTREDLAVITVRSAEYKGIKLNGSQAFDFGDSGEISDYAEESVKTLAKCGIMVGYDGNFEPQGSVTRAMAAKVIYEFLKL